MTVDIYNTTAANTFLIVPAGATPPDGFQFRVTRLFKRITLEAGKPRIALDTDQVLTDIAAQGWAVVGAAVVIEVHE